MRGVTEARGRLSRWLGARTPTPRHRAADRPTLALVPPPPTVYELNRNAVSLFWRAEVDGDGCAYVVVNREGTAETGNPPLADFVNERLARHVAELHNDWLDWKVRNR